MYELFQVICVLELIKRGELFGEPLQGCRLGVLSGWRLGQSLDFSCRHVPASGDVGSDERRMRAFGGAVDRVSSIKGRKTEGCLGVVTSFPIIA